MSDGSGSPPARLSTSPDVKRSPKVRPATLKAERSKVKAETPPRAKDDLEVGKGDAPGSPELPQDLKVSPLMGRKLRDPPSPATRKKAEPASPGPASPATSPNVARSSQPRSGPRSSQEPGRSVEHRTEPASTPPRHSGRGTTEAPPPPSQQRNSHHASSPRTSAEPHPQRNSHHGSPRSSAEPTSPRSSGRGTTEAPPPPSQQHVAFTSPRPRHRKSTDPNPTDLPPPHNRRKSDTATLQAPSDPQHERAFARYKSGRKEEAWEAQLKSMVKGGKIEGVLPMDDPAEDSDLAHLQSVIRSPNRKVGVTSATALFNEPSPNDKAENKKEFVKGADVVRELVMTERNYIDDLYLCCTVFLYPCKNQEILNPKTYEKIFSTMEAIYIANAQLLPLLEARLKDWGPESRLGDLLLSNIKLLEPHVEFAANYERALAELKKLEADKKETAWHTFLKGALRKPELKYRTLDDFLIMPVQRVPRYEMLVTALLKKTDESHPDHSALAQSVEELRELAHRINKNTKKLNKQKK